MRRKDREITDRETINEIIRSCDCCRLGFRDRQGVYILPLNFGFTEENGQRVFFFHGAAQGKKAELIKSQPHIGFELDTAHEVESAPDACGYSFRYKSVIGEGSVCFINNDGEKRAALCLIMEHYTGKADWQFDERILASTAVIKLTVTSLSCKERK